MIDPKTVTAPWRYEIMELTFGRARIVLTDGMFVEDLW